MLGYESNIGLNAMQACLLRQESTINTDPKQMAGV